MLDLLFRWQIRHVVHLSVRPGLDHGAGVPVLLPELARTLIPRTKGVQFVLRFLPGLHGLIYRRVDPLVDLCGATLPQRFGSGSQFLNEVLSGAQITVQALAKRREKKKEEQRLFNRNRGHSFIGNY